MRIFFSLQVARSTLPSYNRKNVSTQIQLSPRLSVEQKGSICYNALKSALVVEMLAESTSTLWVIWRTFYSWKISGTSKFAYVPLPWSLWCPKYVSFIFELQNHGSRWLVVDVWWAVG
jgi:hypothetical protein